MEKINLKDKKLLVLVESPTKVHKISDFLKKLGYNARVLPTVGHTTEIKNNLNSYYNTGIYPEQNFKVDYGVAADKVEVVKNIKLQRNWADIVIIASDPDREGENLGNHIKEILKLKDNEYYRVMYHSITEQAVKEAIENPTKMNINLVDAAEARQILDKIMGYRLSGIVRSQVSAKSAGRCQSIGLKLIADRENEIRNFKPETYFDIYLNFTKNKTEFKAKYVGTDLKAIDHLKTQEEADRVKAECTGQYIIKSIDKREKYEATKPPFCTLTYQQEVSNKLGLKIKDVMSIAQFLFENGYITYLRSDSTDIAPEFIDVLKNYVELNFGKARYVAPKKGKKQENAQEGHECLRITDPALTPDKFNEADKNDLHQKVYKMIWQRTIAACLPSAVISETTYNIYNNKYKFTLVSNEIIDEGYRFVYNYKDDDQEATTLVKETFAKDETLQNTFLDILKKETKSPARFKEATLVKALEKNEIGRPSTTATIVETVLSESRGYATLDDKKFIVPTEKGMQLAAFVDQNFSNVINLNYTKEMEEDLDKIAAGKLTKLDFLTGFYNNLENTIKNNEVLSKKSITISTKPCPKCGSVLVVRNGKYGKFLSCSNYPKCKYTETLKK